MLSAVQVFGRAAFEACGQHFRALRFSSEDAGKYKHVRSLLSPSQGAPASRCCAATCWSCSVQSVP